MYVSESDAFQGLQNNLDHNDMVKWIEHTPKAVEKSSTAGEIDGEFEFDNELKEPTLQESAYTWAEDLMIEIGLTIETIRKYREFTGIKAKERLGMSASERQTHYRKVSYARGRYPERLPYLCTDGSCGECMNCLG